MVEESVFIGANVEREFKEKAETRAKQLGLNMSNYIRFLISQDMERTGTKIA